MLNMLANSYLFTYVADAELIFIELLWAVFGLLELMKKIFVPLAAKCSP